MQSSSSRVHTIQASLPGGGSFTYKRPWIYPKQRRAIFNKKRGTITEAGTKTGKTVGCIIWIFEKALLAKSGQHCWWVSPSHGQSRIAYDRLKKFLLKNRNLPAGFFKSNDSDRTITVLGSGTIWFKSGEKPDLLYGEDVVAVVIDEASRTREEVWPAIRSTLTATRGAIRIIGNVKGKKNWAYRMARKYEHAENPAWSVFKLTTFDAAEAGVIDKAEVEAAREELPEEIFNELYLGIPNDDGSNPFGEKNIEACTVASLSALPPVVLGIDLAKSVDWTVIYGLDKNKMPCHFQRFQKDWQSTTEIIDGLIRKHGVPACIDSTGVGGPIVEKLQSDHGVYDPEGTEEGLVLGYVFSNTSKQRLMGKLRTSMHNQNIGILEGVTVSEFELFEYQYTRSGGVSYSAPSGCHDDAVCSVALADWIFEGATEVAEDWMM